MTANRPSSVPKVASSKRHFMLAPSGPGGSIQYACTNSAGGEPSTLSVPDSSQHSARCAISVRPIASSGTPSARHSVPFAVHTAGGDRSEEHTSELQSQSNLVCRLLLEKKKKKTIPTPIKISTRTHAALHIWSH